MKLSKEAESALVNTTGRRGAPVPAQGPIAEELEAAGYVGRQYGITEAGLVARARIFNIRLDDAF